MLYYILKYTNLRTQTLANKACKISGINFREYKNSKSYHINFHRFVILWTIYLKNTCEGIFLFLQDCSNLQLFFNQYNNFWCSFTKYLKTATLQSLRLGALSFYFYTSTSLKLKKKSITFVREYLFPQKCFHLK